MEASGLPTHAPRGARAAAAAASALGGAVGPRDDGERAALKRRREELRAASGREKRATLTFAHAWAAEGEADAVRARMSRMGAPFDVCISPCVA